MESMFSSKFDNSKYKPRGDNIPRILLRGWHPGTAAAALGLNTDRGIYPFAWHYLLPTSNDGSSREPLIVPPRLTELSGGQVTALASAHICSDTEVLSPFTSWTADLPTGVFFALGSYDEVQGWEMNEPGHIAVVDLLRPYPIIHAPDLGCVNLPMEFLIHGPVTQGLRVVSVAAVRDALHCERWPFCHSVTREPHPVTEEEIRDSIRVGLLFQNAEDKHIDIAVVIMASLISWSQVPVDSPRPLDEADLLRAERQHTRPWPQADLENILGSRLLVHNRAGPPLSGAPLANSLTSTVGAPQLELTIDLLTWMQAAWGPASDESAGTSQPRLTREQWEAAFREAANRHTPMSHSCGPFRCHFCGESRAVEPTDLLRPVSIGFCNKQCLDSHARKERVEKAAEFP